MSGKRKDETNTVFDREMTWLQFNHRVQMEADNPKNPLLERAKFLSIVTSNLDEFMQVRYHGVLEAGNGGKRRKMLPCGMMNEERLRFINKEILHQQNMQYLLYEGLRSELYLHGVQIYPVFTLTDAMKARVKELFLNELLPRFTPRPWGEEIKPFSQKKLQLMVKLSPRSGTKARFATISIPSSPRLIELPAEGGVKCLITLEDFLKLNLQLLFPGETIEQASVFRILRNQDFPINPNEEVSTAVREMLLHRRSGKVMRLEAEERMTEEMLGMLMERFEVPRDRRYRVTGPLDLNKLMMSLYGMVDRPELKFAKVDPRAVPELMGEDIFEKIAKKDYLLFHPYHSFDPVVHLVSHASHDADVSSIKMTLYRVSSNSPIVKALTRAAENGKEVLVLFEAQARFDEENNLLLGERLKRAGCTVIYGIPGLKTHSKITLITRVENGETKRYLHLGTGNYHDGTAKLYTDMGLLTADAQLGEDAVSFFYQLEGLHHTLPTQALVKAPDQMKTTILHLIEREKENAQAGLPARIIAKMNSLLDDQVIEALYAASCAGVKIDLIVRGICTLVPHIEGMSENINVTSIVGRQLEHARAFRFENGGEPEVYLSSADWMPRNLNKRVELMFPVKDAACRTAVENVLFLQLADNEKGWTLHSNGSYMRKISEGMTPVNAQETLLDNIDGVFDGSALQALGLTETDGKAENA